MSTQEYAKLRELAGKLTEGCAPGPWHGVEGGDKAAYSWWLDNAAGDSSFPEPDDVATMLNAVPGLLDDLEALRKAARQMRREHDVHYASDDAICIGCALLAKAGFPPLSAPGQVGAQTEGSES